jgi:alkylation response protein AidB-like acyl-CoA dehydrogenase
MNFDLTADQTMMRESFARFLDEHSAIAKVRAAAAGSGFDAEMWHGLAELGALAIRVPEASGGLGLGLVDAGVLMEEAGRTLVSGPLAEALVAARLLAELGGDSDLLGRALAGEAVVTLAFRDIAAEPVQWIAGGAVAEAVIARKGGTVVLVTVPAATRHAEPNLASTPLAEIDLGACDATVLAEGDAALTAFAAGIEEWKLLVAIALAGLGGEALKLAAAYASERKQFGQFIGQFQAISHPLADLVCEVDGGKFLVWKAVRDIADGSSEAGAAISLALWWNANAMA